MQQESVTAETSGESVGEVSHPKKAVEQQQLLPPQDLIAFPPLAYLLNILLIGLNHLKDCPLLSLQPLLTHRLREIMTDLCSFILLHAADIKETGKKYLISSSPASASVGTEMGDMSMDQLYAKQMQRVVGYGLLCFQLIYSGYLYLLSSFSLSPLLLFLSHSLFSSLSSLLRRFEGNSRAAVSTDRQRLS
jgi:hypothetical protein